MTHIRGKPFSGSKVVYELRYNFGYSYLDHCGRVINRLLRQDSGWLVADPTTPQGSNLLHLPTGLQLAFSSHKLDLSWENDTDRTDLLLSVLDSFYGTIDKCGSIIIEQLGVTSFSRVGFRQWYLGLFESSQAAHDWMTRLPLFQFAEQLESALGGKSEAASLTHVSRLGDIKLRTAVTGFSRSLKKRKWNFDEASSASGASQQLKGATESPAEEDVKQGPGLATSTVQEDAKVGVLIDFDASQSEPTKAPLGQFAREAHRTIEDCMSKLAAIELPARV